MTKRTVGCISDEYASSFRVYDNIRYLSTLREVLFLAQDRKFGSEYGAAWCTDKG